MRGHSRGLVAVVAGGFAAAAMTLVLVASAPESGAQIPPFDDTVTLQNNQYSPAAIALPRSGMTVRWIHRDGETPHTVTLDHKDGQSDFDSHPACSTSSVDDCWQQSDSNSDGVFIQFNSPGTYGYHCKIHGVGSGTMKGTVTVQGTAPTGATTSTVKKTTTTKANTVTTVGTLTTTSTTIGATTSSTSALATTSSSSGATTSSSIGFTTQTTIGGTALGNKSDDDDKPGGVLQAVGVLLLAAVVAALIPAWRRLT